MEDLGKRIQPHVPTLSEAEDLFRRGELTKAIRAARGANLTEAEIQSKVLSAARKMYLRCQAGVLLSVVEKLERDVGYDIPTLLRRIYACQDYHGFLKHSQRLNVGSEFAQQIEAAIQIMRERGRVDEADSWRRKFSYLHQRQQ